MTAAYHCVICGTDALELIAGYSSLPRATSDSRPWPKGGTLTVCAQCGTIQKIPDTQWRDEIARIYSNYDIYHQSGGSEQLIFGDSGAAEPRSKRLVAHIIEEVRPPSRGKLLDIGCGNGVALSNFSHALPNWELYGSELNDKTLGALGQIKNFTKLFVGPLERIQERFSLISLIHTLEHLQTPLKTLRAARDLLQDGGTLFVEVPDIETSPFDLLVADHLLHLSRATLAFLLARCDFNSLSSSNEFIPKEITVLARRGAAKFVPLAPANGIRLAKEIVEWLQQVIATAEEACARGSIGIFGTAIAGMALYGVLKDRVMFFVDEDPNRIGRHYDGRPVLGLAEAPKHIPILVALPPDRARHIVERCSSAGLRCILPPDANRIGI